MANPISGITQRLAVMALDAYELRHQVIANNIANASSAGFSPQSVNFEAQLSALQAAITRGAGDEELNALAAQIHPYIETALDSMPLADQKARLDQQMILMTQNTVQYEAVLTAIGKQNSLMHMAISGEVS